MSENNQPYKSPQDDDDVPPCCKRLSTNQRKIGFYITLLVGVVLYITAIVNFFGSVFGNDVSYMYALIAAVISLLTPLWMNSFAQVLSGLREPSRKLTFLILLISIVGLFTFRIFNVRAMSLICIFALILSGIWLSISYYKNGQESFIECFKRFIDRMKGNNNNNNNNVNNNNNLNSHLNNDINNA